MAEGLNRVTLLGNLGAEPELRQAGDNQVLSLRLATTESFVDKQKNKQEKTEWHTVTVWGARAAGLAKILYKGDRILVEGSIATSSYEKDGEKKYITKINAKNIVLCGSKSKPEQKSSSSYDDYTDDDIPF